MPTKQERIQKLRDQAAEYRQTAEAKEEEARKLAVEDRKIQADKDRKHEAKVKITLGAGLLLLESSIHVPIVRAIRSVLAPRDQEFVARWCKAHEDDFDESKFRSRLAHALSEARSNEEARQEGNHPHPASSADPKAATPIIDPVASALKSILGGLTEGAFGLIAPDILDHATEDQRTVLESWIATRTAVEAGASDSSTDDPKDQPANDPSTDGTKG